MVIKLDKVLCGMFWPWPCTKHNSCLLLTEEPTNRNVLITYLMYSEWTQNKRFCTAVDLPTEILVSLFSLLMLCFTESGAAVCEYFMRNMCNRGPLCPFRHTKGEKTVVCKHWLRGLCKKGDQCEFLHEYDMTKMPECYFYSKFGEFVLMLLGYYQHYIPAEFL